MIRSDVQCIVVRKIMMMEPGDVIPRTRTQDRGVDSMRISGSSNDTAEEVKDSNLLCEHTTRR